MIYGLQVFHVSYCIENIEHNMSTVAYYTTQAYNVHSESWQYFGSNLIKNSMFNIWNGSTAK